MSLNDVRMLMMSLVVNVFAALAKTEGKSKHGDEHAACTCAAYACDVHACLYSLEVSQVLLYVAPLCETSHPHVG